ncbi:DUF5666 domain-containing protein [Cupriavidus sp. CV2]|uniref:DUF5666 domain-containing protein n=1 Tax=Cupriavidus ulmosensis TaxID=3065913 RepID=UPI00296B3AA4|nr:DUF5666 domain-containing protein [Cupriavidus sp. CV2]MDW3682868.1 DUF5666 domain-containing protein [Cupriavidus sp. CV2]
MTEGRSRRRITTRTLWLAAAAGTTALVVACGGGGGDGAPAPSASAPTATPTTFSGAITGFGSIIVNGVRIDNSAARTTLDDDNPNAGADDLKLGMVVDVQGERDSNAQTGRATSIASRSFVQGPVSAINTAANSLVVLGVSVTVSPATVFSGANLTGLPALAVNDTVEIHGLPDATGTNLKATRIERKSPTSEARLVGTAQNVTGSSFTINGITVQFSPAALVNLPSGLTNGAVVRVKGTLTSPTVIAATKVRGASLTPAVVQGLRAEIEGTITKLTSATDFEVSGLRVAVPGTATVSGTPVLGARVEVKGAIANGVLVAVQLEVEDEAHQSNEANELHGAIASLNKSAQTLALSIGGVTVQWNSATAFDNATLPRGADDLAVGMRLDVRGKTTGNAVVASRIKRDN